MPSVGRLVDPGMGWWVGVGEGEGAREVRVGDAGGEGGGEVRGESSSPSDKSDPSASAATAASMSV
jgi:hypothetical protein